MNVLFNATATQSSNYDNTGVASRAIDGDTNEDYYHGSCTHTSLSGLPSAPFPSWWMVDFGHVVYVARATIYNRINGLSCRLYSVTFKTYLCDIFDKEYVQHDEHIHNTK